MNLPEKLVQEFENRFGSHPAILVRAPGRVNLIGEHTDYNEGFVMPIAIDRAVWIALRPRPDRRVEAHSLDFGGEVTFSLDALTRGPTNWVEYLKGVAWALMEAGFHLQGWEGVIAGDVPIGAGLSSSAAIEMATARAFAAAANLPWDPLLMAKLGQRAENSWVGMNCGIMDQMISAVGRAGYAVLIDCRSLETQAVPLPPSTVTVILDTATRRGLVGSAYNERRAQCEMAAQIFGVPALRDVTVEQFEAQAGRLDPVTRRRARHVVTENDRTLRAAEAMRRGDAVELGRLMDASHASLRDDFEVSTDHLNTMVECAHQQEGCYGARMTGAGFGGCAVALVRLDTADAFANCTAECYTRAAGLTPTVYICHPSDGAAIIELNCPRPAI